MGHRPKAAPEQAFRLGNAKHRTINGVELQPSTLYTGLLHVLQAVNFVCVTECHNVSALCLRKPIRKYQVYSPHPLFFICCISSLSAQIIYYPEGDSLEKKPLTPTPKYPYKLL